MDDKKNKEVSVEVNINDFIETVYTAYSEMVNREGFFGLKPEQKYIDALWTQSLQPRIVYHWENLVANRKAKAEREAKQKAKEAKKGGKDV